jgi:hypothetical protein
MCLVIVDERRLVMCPKHGATTLASSPSQARCGAVTLFAWLAI